MTNATYHTLTTDDHSIFQDIERVRRIGRNKRGDTAVNNRWLAVKRETTLSAQNEENLLMRMGMLLCSFTSFVSEQSDFDLRPSDQSSVGRGMHGRDKFLWNIFKLVDGHNNLIKRWAVYETAITRRAHIQAALAFLRP